jgi:hypothetical protein
MSREMTKINKIRNEKDKIKINPGTTLKTHIQINWKI